MRAGSHPSHQLRATPQFRTLSGDDMKAHLCYRVFVVLARQGNMAIYPVAARQQIQAVISHSAPVLQRLLVDSMVSRVDLDKTNSINVECTKSYTGGPYNG